MKKILTITGTLLLAGVCCTEATEWYAGAAPLYLSVNSDHSSIDGQSGFGYQLIQGIRWKHTGFELTMGGVTIDTKEVTDIYYPADSAEYSIIDVTAKYHFRINDNDRFIPWAGIGTGFHFVNWDSYVYSISGVGFSASAGFDYRMFHGLSLRGAIKNHWVRSDGSYDHGSYGGNTLEASLGMIWLFSRNTY